MHEADLFGLLESVHDAAFAVDQQGIVRFWSSSAERLFGLPASKATGQPCCTIVSGLDASGACLCGPDCAVLELSRSSAPVRSYDLEVKTSTGARKWVNVSILIARLSSCPPLVVHLMRDIAARKKLESVARAIAVEVAGLTGQQAEEILDRARDPAPAISLTPQEIRIIELLSLGRGTASIARELHVSQATVRNHIQHLLRKLNAHTRLEAVMRAIRLRLI